MEKVFASSHLLCDRSTRSARAAASPSRCASILENIEEMGEREKHVCVLGIGCYTAFAALMDIDCQQAMHGRAPAQATGSKRVLPDRLVFTLQGDGDMVTEGLQEVIHCAARGEKIHRDLPQQRGLRRDRRPHDRDERDRPAHQEHARRPRSPSGTAIPIRLADLMGLEGVAYLARGTMHTPAGVK